VIHKLLTAKVAEKSQRTQRKAGDLS